MTDHERSFRVSIDESVGGDGLPVDCTLQSHPGTTVRELIEVGARRGLWPSPREPWLASAPSTGRRAESDEPLSLLALRQGDLVEIQAADRTFAGADPRLGAGHSHELAVISGPDSGGRVPLGTAPITVGRGEDCQLVLDDPSLSQRHFRLEPQSLGWAVVDLRSNNGTAIDGTLITPEVPALLAEDAEIEAGRSVLAVRRIPAAAAIEATLTDRGETGINRAPRMVPAPLAQRIPGPSVPDQPRGVRLPLIASIVPLLGGVMMWQLLHEVMFLAFTALSPVMMIGTYVSDRMGTRGEFRKAQEQLSAETDALSTRMGGLLLAERSERRDRHPDAAEVARRVIEGDRRLWERRPSHLDHLTLRVGLADQPSELLVEHGTGGDEALRRALIETVPPREMLINVPAVIDLAEVGVVGIVGPPAERAAVTRWLSVQLAALHSPRDVQLAAILGEADAEEWEWLKWLPHVHDSLAETIGTTAIATRTLQVSRLVDGIASLQQERIEERGAFGGLASSSSRPAGPDLVVIVEDAGVHDRAAMADVLANAKDTGVHVIWEASEAGQLPGACRVIVEIDEVRATATITDTVERTVQKDVSLEGLSEHLTDQISTHLAPLRDITQADRGVTALPAIAHLADLERITNLTADTVLDRWSRPAGPATFTLGASPDGPFVLDLVEHGPHALVGGTPGAGKSELLRGILASLALRYPPSAMTFLLVDFKGGAAFREFADMPHTVGIVTDLDEHLAERALTSFRAEIKYRESVLERHGAIDVLDLARRAPDVRMPRLLIVIDEFATLAQEVPAFVDGVIDVTQRGRSLGVHLVLATQSPRGSVTGKIRANTNLAIALRTVSADESNDILGTNDAAAIPVPRKGRAWARIGDRDLIPFQSGYVGASTLGSGARETTVEPFRIAGVPVGRPAAAGAVPVFEPGELATTDLEAIAAAVAEAFERSGEERPRAPWLPELPNHLALGARRGAGSFGVLDEPERQRQIEVAFSPAEDGSLIVLGGPRSGKTSTIATIAGTLCEDAAVEDLHVYGLDCAGRALSAIAALPHCGTVVPADDVERTGQLLSLLARTIQERRDRASEAGASDFAQLRELRPSEPLPRLLVLIDDFGGFQERYERVEGGQLIDQLRALIGDGPSFGVHFLITADRRGAIPMSVAAAVPRRLVHRMADRDEYVRAGLPTSFGSFEIVPGRCFTDDAGEVQVATWLETPSESLREAFARRGAVLRARAGTTRPKTVEMLPPLVHGADGPVDGEAWTAFLGLRETELRPAILDLSDAHFIVAGPYRSGRSTALAGIVRGLLVTTPGLQTHLVAPRRTSAEGALPWTSVIHGSDHAPVVELFETLLDDADSGIPSVLVIDDATEVDPNGISGLDRLLRQARDLPLRVIIGADTQTLRTSYGSWLVQLRKEGRAMVLNPNLETDGDMFGVRFPWRRQISFPVGRGMLVEAGTYDVVQVVGD